MIFAGATLAIVSAMVRDLSDRFHPFEIVFFRLAFAFPFVLPLLIKNGFGQLKSGRMGMHFVRSLMGWMNMVCMFWALSLIPMSQVTALSFAGPLFAAFLAIVFLGEKAKLRRWLALLVGSAGAMIVLRPGYTEWSLGILLAIIMAMGIGVVIVLLRSLSRTERPEAVILYLSLFSTPLALIMALPDWVWPQGWDWLLLALLGMTATFAQYALVKAYGFAEATAVLPFDFARLLFVAALDFVWFGVIPDIFIWIGGTLILASSVYIAHRERVRAKETTGEN